MLPILLQAHTRALTKITFNKDSDLIFTAAKDDTPYVWYSQNGEMLGSFKGHGGSVWSIDVTSDSRMMASGSADNSCRLWDVETGKCKAILSTETAVRSVAFSMGDHSLAFITDATMGKKSMLHIHDYRTGNEPRLQIELGGASQKATVAKWTDCNEAVLTGHQDGSLNLWSPVTGEKMLSNTAHTDQIKDIQFAPDMSYFITASKDTSAKIFDTTSLACVKTYKTERPVNSASISSLRHEVCIAGGQEALQVTTTSSRAGQFEARFFHRVFETELGRVCGHFGPINTLAYRPDGLGYASGAEDGFVRLHMFDQPYFDFDFQGGVQDAILA